ncbi:MAG: DNA-directed RNA polymerase subunit omega [Nitrospirota bacterium]
MDIIKLPIEYGNDLFDSRFRLVLVVAQRGRQLTEGSPALVKKKYVKNISLALEEAIEGKLKYLTGEDAKRAREYEYRMRRERIAKDSMEEAAAASLEKMEEIKEAYKAETAVLSEAESVGADLEEDIIPEDEEESQEEGSEE